MYLAQTGAILQMMVMHMNERGESNLSPNYEENSGHKHKISRNNMLSKKFQKTYSLKLVI